jgi:hypothetical protein
MARVEFALALHRNDKTAEEASCDQSGLDFVAREAGKSLFVGLLRSVSEDQNRTGADCVLYRHRD